jgi:signal transduction histidine kinase
VSASVARRVATSGATLLISTLVLVGAATAIVLHTRQVDGLDQALLAAAHGRAHPDVAADVEVEHSHSPVEAWLVRAGDGRVPDAAIARAVRAERPLFVDVGERRLVLLPFEVEHGAGAGRGLAAAAAPRVTVGQSVGPFALAYALLAALAALIATFIQVQVVRRAFRPLDQARDEVTRVLALGEGKRLTEVGPIEVRALLVATNDLLARLEAAHRAQSRFTAEAAHELRTPVTTMLGELDVALRAPRTADAYRETLVSTREEVSRLRQLVEGLTALARIDAGQVDQGRERLRAAELATAALDHEARSLLAAGASAQLEVTTDPELDGHRALLEVALANLLRNAARHAPGSTIAVRIGEADGCAFFTVDDAGPGVPTGEREALFDRFTRGADARHRDRGGLGLGLPIAREVARRHGGDCVLDTAPGGGLRVTLSVRALAPPRTTPGA